MLTSVLSRTEYPALKITLGQSKFPLRIKTTIEGDPETHANIEKYAITKVLAVQLLYPGC